MLLNLSSKINESRILYTPVVEGVAKLVLQRRTLHAHSLDAGLQVYRFIPRFAGLLYEKSYPLEQDYELWFRHHTEELALTAGTFSGKPVHYVCIDTVHKHIIYTGSARQLKEVFPPDYPVLFSEVLKDITPQLQHRGYTFDHPHIAP
jgi:hypothetical protein